jgi:hypothetical protein
MAAPMSSSPTIARESGARRRISVIIVNYNYHDYVGRAIVLVLKFVRSKNYGKVKFLDRLLGTYVVHGRNISLSAGLNRKSAQHDVISAIWQRTGITECLAEEGKTGISPVRYLGPYHLRNALIINLDGADVADC